MESIRDYSNFYAGIKNGKGEIKKFSFLTRPISLITYLKKEKKNIIENINYAFFPSDEPYLLSTFCSFGGYFVHINSRMTEDRPRHFDSVYEFENYLAIYATFGILIGESFQISSLNDSRLFYREFLSDLTYKIYYDEAFRLNLEAFIDNENEVLKYVYRYGYDFLLECFKLYYRDRCSYGRIKRFLKISDKEFKLLFDLYESKIVLEEF